MNLKDLFSRQVILQSPKKPDEVTSIIKSNVTSEFFFFGNGKNDPFKGRVGKKDFSVYKTYMGNNSFRAHLDGDIEPSLSGSTIKIGIHVMWFALVFTIVWGFLLVITMFFADKVGAFRELPKLPTEMLPFIIGIFTLFWFSYRYGAKTSLESLVDLLGARVVDTSREKVY